MIAAIQGDRTALTSEAADVLYHLLVMLAARDVTLDDVYGELARREGTSGIAEKAARPKGGSRRHWGRSGGGERSRSGLRFSG